MENKLLRTVLVFFLLGTGNTVFSQSLNPLVVGTIRPGDSIVIYYDVTINNPCACIRIANQGTVTGSNFTALSTDDPDTAPLGDSTVTLLNMYPLPAILLEFRGNHADGKVQLSWKVNESNVDHYDIEKSSTGSAFIQTGTVPAVGTGTRSYGFADQNINGEVNYYRLKIVDADGKISYSAILRFSANATGKSVLVFPNPVTNSQVTVRFSNLSAGQYTVGFYNSIGQPVFTRSITHGGGSSVINLKLPEGIGAGLVTMVVQGEGSVYTQKVIIARNF